MWFFHLIISIILLSTQLAIANTVDPSLNNIIQNANTDDMVPIIIHLSDKVKAEEIKDKAKTEGRKGIIKSLKNKAEKTQGRLRSFLITRGGKNIKPFWIINSIAAEVPVSLIEELKSFVEIESISYDSVVVPPPIASGTSVNPLWNISRIRAPELWHAGFKGQGIVVANMDTGVDLNHPELQNKWRGGMNSWFDPYNEHPLPFDSTGHGTATMGIMVGGDRSEYATGVAPDAQWIAVKIFNDAGQARFSTIHEGFQWILDPDNNPDTDDAPDVLNNSWALNAPNQCITEFRDDILALKESNIFVVFAGGNYNPPPPSSVSPANNQGVLSVGAIDEENNIANFSSRGPSACDNGIFPSVVAPGVNIYTADLYSSYGTFSGTSFAAPHVAGAAALLFQALPWLSVYELESGLLNSAVDLGPAGPDNSYGHGLIDIFKAFLSLTGRQIHTITATASSGGSISPSGTVEVITGYNQTFTIVPDNGYRVLGVLVDGVAVGSLRSYRFNNVRGDHTISVSFAPAADIEVSSTMIDFGDVRLWKTAEESLTIRDIGIAELVINRVGIEGRDASLFYTRGVTVPIRIQAGSSISMQVGFRSRPRGLKTATLKIYSNDPDTPILTVPLRGFARN